MAKIGIEVDTTEVGEWVYKYRSFRNVNHLRLLLADELYFASPRELNDPFDCAIDIQWQNQPAKEILKDLINEARRQYPEFPARKQEEKARQAHRELLCMIDDDPEGYARELQIGWEERMNEDKSLCSLSRTALHPLLWSHYADSHKGFCVGLNYPKLFEWMKALSGTATADEIRPLRVKYISEMEVLDPSEHEASTIFGLSMTRKHSDWGYEEETRLLCFGRGSHVRVLPEGIVSRVVLGAKMPEEDRVSVQKMLRGRPNIEIWEVRKRRGSYELELHDLATSDNPRDI